STADGQIIFFLSPKEAKGRRLTALPEVNRGLTLTSNFPPPSLLLTRAALKNCSTNIVLSPEAAASHKLSYRANTGAPVLDYDSNLM
ncbi:hypothetical protein CRENBAI_011598, partial [Crenichthys baileyi]